MPKQSFHGEVAGQTLSYFLEKHGVRARLLVQRTVPLHEFARVILPATYSRALVWSLSPALMANVHHLYDCT